MLKVLGKGVRRPGKRYHNMDKISSSTLSFKQYFIDEPRFNGVFSGDNLLRIKDGAFVIKFNDKAKEHIGFHYLLTKILLHSLILLELNVVHKNYYAKLKNKSISYNIFRIQNDDFFTCPCYSVALIESTIAG